MVYGGRSGGRIKLLHLWKCYRRFIATRSHRQRPAVAGTFGRCRRVSERRRLANVYCELCQWRYIEITCTKCTSTSRVGRLLKKYCRVSYAGNRITFWIASAWNYCRFWCIQRCTTKASQHRIVVRISLNFCNWTRINAFLFSLWIWSNAVLTRAIENVLPPLDSNDSDLLVLKAISAASTHCLFQCMNLLQRQYDVCANVRSEAMT